MADIAQLAVHLGLDASALSAGAQKAVSTLDSVGKAAASMAAQFQAAATVLSVGGNATNTLAQIGIQTTQAIDQEIAAISRLKAELPATDAATAQLSARQEYLAGVLRRAEQGAYAEAGALSLLASEIMRTKASSDGLAKIGVKTTQVLQAEIAAYDKLIAAMSHDAAATQQLIARKQALVSTLNAQQANLAASAGAMMGAATAEEALAAAGITTSAALQQQIANLKALMVAAQGDAVALGQLKARMSMLQGATMQASGAIGSASFAVISLGQGFQDAGQFGMGLSQGIRAVTNNAQMAFQAFIMLRQQSESAAGAMKAFWAAMKGPAGWLLAFGIVTAAIEGITNKLQKAKGEAKELDDKIRSMYSIAVRPDVISVPVETLRDAAAEATRNIKSLRTEYNALLAMGASQTTTAAPGGFAPAMAFDAATQAALDRINKQLEEQQGFLSRATADLKEYDAEMERLAVNNGFKAFEDLNRELALTRGLIFDLGGKPMDLTIDKFVDLYVETGSATGAANAFMASLHGVKGGLRETVTPLQQLVEEIRASQQEWQNLTSMGEGLFAVIGKPDNIDRIQELQDQIRELARTAGREAATEIARLVAEIERLRGLLPPPKKMEGLMGAPMNGEAPTTLEMPQSLIRTREQMQRLNEEARSLSFALVDGINQELERTQILLATMPISAIDQLSGAIGESVGQLVTFQGGFEDFGKNVLQAMQSIVAEMVALIVKQKILNALKKEEAATTGLIAGLSAGNIAGLGIALGAFGFASALFGRRPARQTASGIDYGRPMPRMAVEGVVLRSGDIEFSVAERRAVNARIGR